MRSPDYWRNYEQSEKRKAWVAQYKAEGRRQAALDRYAGSEKQKTAISKASAKRSAARAANRAANPKPPPIGYAESQKRYNGSETRRDRELRKRYRLTQEDVEALKSKTQCAICGRDDMKLVTDHKHDPHQVRDRLCRYCNIMVGVLEHSNFQKAVDYLAHWNSMLPD